MLLKLLAFLSRFQAIPSVVIDGTIAVCIIFLTFWQTIFGGDEAAKWIHPRVIFWLKSVVGSFAVSLVGLQSFRSRLYAQHQQKKEDREKLETSFTTKPTP